MWWLFGKKIWAVISFVSIVLGIGGWEDNAKTWTGWFGGMSPELFWFLIGAGFTGLVLYLLAKWKERVPPTPAAQPTPPAKSLEPAKPLIEPKKKDSWPPHKDRKQCALTPKELVELVKSRDTSLARDKLLEPYKGTFLSVKGEVKDVESHVSEIAVTAKISEKDDIDVVFLMDTVHPASDFDQYSAGSSFEAKGRLFAVKPNGLIFLRDCRLPWY